MDIKAKKSLGQNFLINQGILDKIILAAELNNEDTVVEVGPGTGLLTQKILEKTKNIIAIEKDHRLIELLKEKFPEIKIIEGDALEITLDNLKAGDYKIVANIPYYITSHFIRQIFESWPQPKCIVLTIQKEVAQRIVAKPPEMNLLALSVQYYAKAEIVAPISRGSFRPIPNVDSAIIKLTPKLDQPSKDQSKKFFHTIKNAFSGKRKQLVNTLSEDTSIDKEKIKKALEDLSLPTTSRAEELSLETWQKLIEKIA